MQRRQALKTFVTALGGIAVLPSWASGWRPEDIPRSGLLSADQQVQLADLAEAIIPETDTPGARTLKVHTFVERMVNDCYETAVKESLRDGLAGLEKQAQSKYGSAFAALDRTQKTQLMTSLEKNGTEAEKQFLRLVKGLTIQGYMNSEYVMTNLTHYELVPGRYHGCVDLKPVH